MDIEQLWEVALEESPAKDILIEVEAEAPDARLEVRAYDSEGGLLGVGRQGSRPQLLVPNKGGDSLGDR